MAKTLLSNVNHVPVLIMLDSSHLKKKHTFKPPETPTLIYDNTTRALQPHRMEAIVHSSLLLPSANCRELMPSSGTTSEGKAEHIYAIKYDPDSPK